MAATITPTNSQQAATILLAFVDFAEQGDDELARYIAHVGIASETLNAAPSLSDAILLHYRVGERFDVDRAAYDLLRWPPVAARVRQLQIDRAEEQAARDAARKRSAKVARNSHMISTPQNSGPRH